MPKKPCMRPGCPKPVDRKQGGYCEDHQKHRSSVATEQRRGTAAERGYDSRWATYSRNRLWQPEHALCFGLRLQPGGPIVINTHPDVLVAATLTDHIIPPKSKHSPLFWDLDNHQSACEGCHNVKTATEDGGFGRAASVRG